MISSCEVFLFYTKCVELHVPCVGNTCGSFCYSKFVSKAINKTNLILI